MSKDALNLARLAELRRRFPAFRIAWELTQGRRPRYVAQRVRDGIHPHTLVTTDLAELHDELSRAGRPPTLPYRGRSVGWGGVPAVP